MKVEDKIKYISIRVWGAYMDALEKPINYKQVKEVVAQEVLNIVAEEVGKAWEAALEWHSVPNAPDKETYLLSQGLTTSPAPEPQK